MKKSYLWASSLIALFTTFTANAAYIPWNGSTPLPSPFVCTGTNCV